MQIYHNNIIPGLMTPGTEFLARPDGTLRVFHNTDEITFDQLPAYVYKTIKKVIGNPEATLLEMEACALKKWGGMDRKIDIDENGNPSEPEYIPNVTSAFYDNGKRISDAQLRVIEKLELNTSEHIANELFISKKTVERHLQDIYAETGFANRTQLAVWAKNKGIN